MKLKKVLNIAITKLDQNNIHSSTFEAKELLCKALNCNKIFLYTNTENELTNKQKTHFFDLIDIILHQPGITQHEIINLLDLGQPAISYNLTNLTRNNLIRVEQHGREKRYYINDNVINSDQYQDQTQSSGQSETSKYMSDSEPYFSDEPEVGPKKY